jgi:sugar phosphate isomerase/epimerase
MVMLSRREFVQAGSLAAILAAQGRAKHLSSIGVQLYTVRTVLPQDPAKILGAIEAAGYKEIECTWAGLDKLWPVIQATRLKPTSIHLDSTIVTKGTDEDVSKALEQVKQKGFQYAVFPYLPPAERGGLDVIRKVSAKLNDAGRKCAALGLTFCYHNHAFEFEPMEGTTPFQVMMDSTDKKLVQLEMDLFWVSVAGHDPAEMLGKMAGRVPLVHLKDKARGTEVMYKESVPRTAFKEVGSGVTDWTKVLRAAESAGVQHYYVEQDQTPGDPVDSLRQSYSFLSKLDY